MYCICIFLYEFFQPCCTALCGLNTVQIPDVYDFIIVMTGLRRVDPSAAYIY